MVPRTACRALPRGVGGRFGQVRFGHWSEFGKMPIFRRQFAASGGSSMAMAEKIAERRATAADILRVQGSELPEDRLALVRMIQSGLSYDAVEGTAAAIGIGMKELALCGVIPVRTLSHSRRTGYFSAAQSNRVMRLIRVWRHARGTFGDADKARTWMNRPTRPLGGRKPAELLDTDEGARLVEELLGRIDHGIAA